MALPPETLERIHRLWDALPRYGAACIEDAMQHMLRELSLLLDVQQACWRASVRQEMSGDPFGGWRPAAIHYLHPQDDLTRRFQDYRKIIEAGKPDPCITANLAGTGSFRVNILSHMMEPAWWKSAFHERYFDAYNIRDVMYIAMPLGDKCESWIHLQRVGLKAARFQPADFALASYACRPLGWFHRTFALHHGVLLARELLTPAERRVLGALLGGGTEGTIATALALTPATVHTYAGRIYRKFGVPGRAALTALWFG